jgi:hypothetical protein
VVCAHDIIHAAECCPFAFWLHTPRDPEHKKWLLQAASEVRQERGLLLPAACHLLILLLLLLLLILLLLLLLLILLLLLLLLLLSPVSCH